MVAVGKPERVDRLAVGLGERDARMGRVDAFDDAVDPDHFGLLTDARLAPVWRETRDFLLT